jgi:hypothetical protein
MGKLKEVNKRRIEEKRQEELKGGGIKKGRKEEI